MLRFLNPRMYGSKKNIGERVEKEKEMPCHAKP
jgi:hypothetical protein